ncbi:MAG: PTS glucose transporter subunit IIA [Anaerorhabdus sp.]
MENKNEVVLNAFAEGTLIDIVDVNDPVFSGKMMGDGVAIKIEKSEIVAPCDCEVILVATTKHAVGLKLDNEAELLIHVGLNSVALNGEGFTMHVKESDKVKKGDILISVDLNVMKDKNIDLCTPLVLTSNEFKLEKVREFSKVLKNEEILKIN